MKRMRLQVAPHPRGFLVIASPEPSIGRPGDVLEPFVLLHHARRWAEVGRTLSLDVVSDGRPSALSIDPSDRAGWANENGGAA